MMPYRFSEQRTRQDALEATKHTDKETGWCTVARNVRRERFEPLEACEKQPDAVLRRPQYELLRIEPCE